MIDELEELRQFRAEVPRPSTEARSTGRSALAQAILADRRAHATIVFPRRVPSDVRRRTERPRRVTKGRRFALSAGVAVAAVAALVGTVLALQPRTVPRHVSGPVATAAVVSMRNSILTAFDATAGDMLSVHQTTTVSDGESSSQDL